MGFIVNFRSTVGSVQILDKCPKMRKSSKRCVSDRSVCAFMFNRLCRDDLNESARCHMFNAQAAALVYHMQETLHGKST